MVSGEEINPINFSVDINFNECRTIPTGSNYPNIHVPFTYFSSNGVNYLVFFTTGSGSPCNNVWGKYYVYTVNPNATTISLSNALSTYQGSQAFYDPNDASLSLGLGSLGGGYARVVNVYATSKPNVNLILSLVYYEKT